MFGNTKKGQGNKTRKTYCEPKKMTSCNGIAQNITTSYKLRKRN